MLYRFPLCHEFPWTRQIRLLKEIQWRQFRSTAINNTFNKPSSNLKTTFKMGIAEITQGKGWKNFMAKLYGLGAAVVIVGALFKIQHWPGAGIMLTIGLGTEAVIFFFSAFEPPHEEVDWSLVYPELAGMHDDPKKDHKKKSGTVTQELDKMLAEAKIGPELIESLGSGLRTLGENTSKLADMTNAGVATENYISSVNKASQSVSSMSDTYVKAANALEDLSSSSGSVKQYGEQLTSAGKNLEALNAMYEMQIKESNSQLQSAGKLQTSIAEMMNNLNASVEDTRRYKDEISQLAKNLSALNTIYGNMLGAMTQK
jgi:gliding motility-associated protein GldL